MGTSPKGVAQSAVTLGRFGILPGSGVRGRHGVGGDGDESA